MGQIRHLLVPNALAMSVAMPEQVENAKAPPSSPAAQLSRLSFTQGIEVQRVGAAVPARWRHYAGETEALGGPDTRTSIVGKHLLPEHRDFPSMPSPTLKHNTGYGSKFGE